MKTPPAAPPAPSSPSPQVPTVQSLQKELAELRQQHRAVSQYLWLVLEARCNETMDIKLRTDRTDPLWTLAFLQVLDAKGEFDPNQIHILAGTLPPLTEQDKKRLVRHLRGTSTKLPEALQHFNFTEYPFHYVETLLSDRIKWNREKTLWESVTPAGLGEKAMNLLKIPT